MRERQADVASFRDIVSKKRWCSWHSGMADAEHKGHLHREGPEAARCVQQASCSPCLTGHALPYRLDKMDASTTEARAAKLLHGLGFNNRMQKQKTRDFSGGWRMRIALARSVAQREFLLWLYLLEECVELCKWPLARPAAWAHHQTQGLNKVSWAEPWNLYLKQCKLAGHKLHSNYGQWQGYGGQAAPS